MELWSNTTPPPVEKSLLDECEITEQTEIAPQTPIITIDNKNYLMKGDFAIITGEKKSGKSHVLRRVIMTALMKDVPQDVDCLHVRTAYSDKLIIYVDTEQHPSKTQQSLNYCWKKAGYKTQPKNLKFYNIRSKETEERVKFIEQLITKFGANIHLVVIDGISDLLDSINDEILSKKLAQTFFANDAFQISYIFAIHERKGGGGAMGWLGQHIEKKAGGGIRIEKDPKTDTHSINCSFLRDDGNFKPIEFKYDTNLHDFRLLDPQEAVFLKDKTKEEKEKEKLLELESIIRQSFGSSKDISKITLKQLIMNNDPQQRGEKTAGRLIDSAVEKGFIIEIKDKKTFRINI